MKLESKVSGQRLKSKVTNSTALVIMATVKYTLLYFNVVLKDFSKTENLKVKLTGTTNQA